MWVSVALCIRGSDTSSPTTVRTWLLSTGVLSPFLLQHNRGGSDYQQQWTCLQRSNQQSDMCRTQPCTEHQKTKKDHHWLTGTQEWPSLTEEEVKRVFCFKFLGRRPAMVSLHQCTSKKASTTALFPENKNKNQPACRAPEGLLSLLYYDCFNSVHHSRVYISFKNKEICLHCPQTDLSNRPLKLQ